MIAKFKLFCEKGRRSQQVRKNFSFSSQGLTARRDTVKEVCYVSKLDSFFSSPGEMKQEMEQVT